MVPVAVLNAGPGSVMLARSFCRRARVLFQRASSRPKRDNSPGDLRVNTRNRSSERVVLELCHGDSKQAIYDDQSGDFGHWRGRTIRPSNTSNSIFKKIAARRFFFSRN